MFYTNNDVSVPPPPLSLLQGYYSYGGDMKVYFVHPIRPRHEESGVTHHENPRPKIPSACLREADPSTLSFDPTSLDATKVDILMISDEYG